jgi:hypothetical protein
MKKKSNYKVTNVAEKPTSKALTPMKSIRAKCLDCCCWQVKEVRECTVQDCALFPYRMGRRPDPSETFLPPKKSS